MIRKHQQQHFILDVRLHLSMYYVNASAGVTQEEGHTEVFFLFFFSTFILRCLPYFFIARRIQPSLSLVDREVEVYVPTT